MLNTTIEGIKCISPGVLTNTEESSYLKTKKEMIMKAIEKERINNMEKDISDMKAILSQILLKVS